jgi:hypothetical protein
MKPLSRQQRLQLASQTIVQPTQLPAPIKGWNTRDALDAMDPLDAVLLDNWFPNTGGVDVRNGYVQYAQTVSVVSFSDGFSSGFETSTVSFTGPVQTLVEFNAGSTRKFLAAGSGNIFDISAGGNSGAPLKTGFASDQWQTVQFLSRLFFVNGVDTPQVFDGTSLTDMVFTGATLSRLIGVVQYQQRLFFWQISSTGFYFAPLNSISGALSFYDLAAFAPRGGNIVAATTFSHDGGNGVQDFIIFIMSSGDACIFFGNDPSDATAWQLVGRYRISPPVSPRAVCNYGAEAFITTFDDHLPLQQQLVALKLGQLPPRSKISPSVQAAVKANKSAFGWQALYYPAGRRLMFNIPNPDGTFSQHVQNTGVASPDGTYPWCRFQDMNAFCWGLFNDKLYFGAAGGIIYQADTGSLDVLGPVVATGQQAWNDFNNPLRKRLAAARPLVQALGSTSLQFAVGFDYRDLNVTNDVVISAIGSPWDTSPWDTSPWSAESQITTQWRISGGDGVAIGVGLNVGALDPVTWLRTDLRFEQGKYL